MSNELTMFNDPNAFQHGMMVAKVFTNSQLVPQHMRGKIEDCFIALNMANLMGEHPLIVMQNIYMVSGKAGWSSSYMIARANKSGVFKSPINWRKTGEGDKLEVTAYATLQNGDEVTASAGMAMAAKEGWTKNAKYQSMPEHMLRYRSATFLIRLFAPEVMLGIPMAEENEDVAAAQAVDITPKQTRLAKKVEPIIEAIEPYMASPVAQSLKQALAASETPHNPETGEVLTDAQAALDGDDIPETFAVPTEMYVLTFAGGQTQEFHTAAEFQHHYLEMQKKVSRTEVREKLRVANLEMIQRARVAMGITDADRTAAAASVIEDLTAEAAE